MSGFLQSIRSADVKTYYSICHSAGNWFLDRLASHEEANNLFKGGIFFAMYWFEWFRVGPDREKRRRAIFAILIGTILAIIAARTIAFVTPFRLRPAYDPTLAHPSYSVPVVANLENWSSFPSDTAAYFFALAFGIAYVSRRLATPVMLYTVVWICLPRIYLGLHYPSDILVGMAIGITTVLLSVRSALPQSMVSSRVLTAAETAPQWFYAIAFLVCFEMATVFDGLRHAGRGVLNAFLVGLHLTSPHSGPMSPIDVWAGLVVTAGFLLSGGYVVLVLYRKFHGFRSSSHDS